jgi:hypothetical protein
VRFGVLSHSALVLLACGGLGCRESDAGAPAVKSTGPRVREASEFSCRGDVCVQRHVRLPDDGEWRCAEREGVVWCAGGEPAAGVVKVVSERGYRCGERRVAPGDRRERVCVDAAPDYPVGRAGEFACRFVEQGSLRRECVRRPSTVRPLEHASLPNCWLDRDCDGTKCDRGSCESEKR